MKTALKCLHSCPILSNRVHPTKQHSICCRSENCISLAISGQSGVDSIDSFDLSNGKVYYRFDKCGRRSKNCISLVTTATRSKIVVESIDSFDWWEWLFQQVRPSIKELHLISDNGDPVQDCRRIDRFVRLVGMVIPFMIPHVNDDKQVYIPRSKNTKGNRAV